VIAEPFSHRRIIIQWNKPVPYCRDCGNPSEMLLIDITTFSSDTPTFLEQPSNRCPNGPHDYYQEARRG
jgi:hypothetical protein